MPSFWDMLTGGSRDSDKRRKPTIETVAVEPARPEFSDVLPTLRNLSGDYPTGASYLEDVDVLRKASPELAGIPARDKMVALLPSASEAGMADRYATGRDLAEAKSLSGILSTLPYVGYEGVKALAQTPGVSSVATPVMQAVGGLYAKALGYKDQGSLFKMDDRTSPASPDNVRALLQGYIDARRKMGERSPNSSLSLMDLL